nr:hypothetical protein [uncultured Allomuricauda sp.]
MISHKNILGIIVLSSLLFACGGSDSSGDTPPDEQAQVPAKTVGTLPENGEPCSDFEEVSGNPFKVSVRFGWNSAQFAQNYALKVFENQTEVSSTTVNTLQTDVVLDRGKTYTWSVTAINSDGETLGDTYSFTTPGVPVGNYAPYAAEITVNFDMTSSEMSVSWIGRDEDGDTLVYDVKVIEGENAIVEETEVSTNFLQPINYMSEVEYGVEVISRDPNGNFSISLTEMKAPN